MTKLIFKHTRSQHKYNEMSEVVLHGNLSVILHFKKQLAVLSFFFLTYRPPFASMFSKRAHQFVFYFSDWENVVETLYNRLITGTNDPSTTQDPGPLCDANNHQFGPYFVTYMRISDKSPCFCQQVLLH